MNEDFVIAVTSALILGSLVGVERQWHRRLVDLKTNALVALGGLFVYLDLSLSPRLHGLCSHGRSNCGGSGFYRGWFVVQGWCSDARGQHRNDAVVLRCSGSSLRIIALARGLICLGCDCACQYTFEELSPHAEFKNGSQ